MATKLTKMNATGVQHTAGIFSDMTVDGPIIGTLVAIIDRAKNLPNRRSMGKQDPYCAARLGKEAKKTTTDKRGGQTPKWDQELRFTVHDSPDYHQLKVSVFNDDKKTELIGETWASLEAILTPGGGQSDTWHGLNCKGKYAGEIRMELTYYDTRPKAEKPVTEKKAESGRAEGQTAAVGGPRGSTTNIPVKRRPLPSDPTGASPSPVSTPERVGLQSIQAGPRSYGTPPRQQRPAESTSTQRRAPRSDAQPLRRPVPESAPVNNSTPSSVQNTPQPEQPEQQQLQQLQQQQQQQLQQQQQQQLQQQQQQQLQQQQQQHQQLQQQQQQQLQQQQQQQQQQPSYSTPQHQHSSQTTPQYQQRPSRSSELDLYSTSLNPPLQITNAPNYNQNGFDMSYTAPKPYEAQSIDPPSQHPQDFSNRTISQIDFRSSQGHTQGRPIELPHSHSVPNVPTHSSYESEPRQDAYAPQSHHESYTSQSRHDSYTSQQSDEDYHQTQDMYEDPSCHIEPLRMSRNSNRSPGQISPRDPYQVDGYMDSHSPYDDHYDYQGRRTSAMQPTVEDEDDMPPPPPLHRSNASTIMQHHEPSPPNYHDDSPAGLNFDRYRQEPAQIAYESPSQSYGANDYSNDYAVVRSTERRYTHPRESPHPISRPVSRDAMAVSPLRSDTSLIPASLVAGYQPPRQDTRITLRRKTGDSNGYESQGTYETPLRLRQYSEPDYGDLPNFENPLQPYSLARYHSADPVDSPDFYSHAPPQEPRHTSPDHESVQLVKPRALSPAIGSGFNPANTRSPVNDRSSRGPTRSMPTRKSVSPRPPPSSSNTAEQRFSAFGPDSFDVLNPTVSRSSNTATNGTEEHERPGSSMEFNDKGQIVTFSGRVIDASDHLPVDSWAPEPERKNGEKERPSRDRTAPGGARDLEAAKERENKYRRERMERERIRNAASASFGSTESTSNALVTTRHHHSSNDAPINAGAMVLASQVRDSYDSVGRNRLQKRNQRPEYAGTQSSPSYIPSPSHVLRERENVGGYGSSPGYGSSARQSYSGPPIPAKIPMENGYGHQSEDMHALSLELQSIDIGPSSGRGRHGKTLRRYG
ncbi:hypothetical protein K504DRAFT_460519 [Pleomassaria siparia CBS 279.74]|uniref:C2 domain-containing protein n=1 Tax=Pleomassaria siparia CBS 279.74 TaxID=1314801 RepID=A0A6G1JXI5_9PLEO|nr:hypothetical protein K504DRAFT_460519 [Pleomassaria siparia CBS 279.74]